MPMAETACDPPLLDRCRELLYDSSPSYASHRTLNNGNDCGGECELPLIDLSCLSCDSAQDRRACVAAIARASSEWGFFQVVNHGISRELLWEMRREQRRLFGMAFQKKDSCCRLLDGSYRWGAPTATCAGQFSWSEAFHIPLSKINEEDDDDDETCNGDFSSLREVMKRLAGAISELAMELAGVLTENLGQPAGFLAQSCGKSSCFLRLNRYPPCPFSPEVFGLVPHTDSDFLTVLYQDEVGGLQLMKDSEWVAVRPNPDALIVNIGDLFQAWSNDVYKSVEHRVVANGEVERYSIAYFMCPSYGSIVGACGEPSVYRSFTFAEYRRQVQEDVRRTGQKVGLPRFLRRPKLS
ncbi:hypothetical protein Taro_026388 [Colocasia esculenta]|uniref:gibberellin 2beta-dioxygenase n=1 Tax=Colocasia esculenta TaxID=4460 RepID=A0A843VKG1_COLES|nr:hypothetical protein [Colocasia esculenta]